MGYGKAKTQPSLNPMSFVRNSAGLSIIEGLVGLGILGLVVSLMAQSQIQIHRNYRALAESAARDDFEKGLIAAVNEGSICKSELKGIVLTSKAWPISFRIKGPGSPILFQINKPVSQSVPSLIPTGFQVVKISDLNASTALVDFIVSYNNKNQNPNVPNLVRPLKDSSIRVSVNLDGAGKILSCSNEVDASDVCTKLGGTYDASAAVKCNIPAFYQ